MLLTLGIVIVLIGLSSRLYLLSVNHYVTYYDKQFVSAVAHGLEDQWSYTDTLSHKHYSKEEYRTMVGKELDQIKEFESKPFKNDDLRVQAIAYIDTVNIMDTLVKDKYGSKDFHEKWQAELAKRQSELVAINRIEKIEVSQDYQKHLKDLLLPSD